VAVKESDDAEQGTLSLYHTLMRAAAAAARCLAGSRYVSHGSASENLSMRGALEAAFKIHRDLELLGRATRPSQVTSTVMVPLHCKIPAETALRPNLPIGFKQDECLNLLLEILDLVHVTGRVTPP
jgi:hypothetical protein